MIVTSDNVYVCRLLSVDTRSPLDSLPLCNHPVDEHEASVEGGVEGLHVADDAVRLLLQQGRVVSRAGS